MPGRCYLRFTAGGALALLFSALGAAAPPAPAVTAVRFWSMTDTTRVVIETTDEFQFRSDHVPNPERLFFDLVGMQLRMGVKGSHTINVSDKLLKQIRVAEPQSNVTRVVFDLSVPVDFTASQLTNPNRLIIELRAAGTLLPGAPPALPVTVTQKLGEAPVAERNAAMSIAKEKVAEAAPLPEVPPLPAPPKIDAKVQSKPIVSKVDEKTLAAIANPKPARLPKNGEPSLSRVLGLKVGKIVIDAGHGGHDTGTSGPGGLLEKDLVLDVAKRLGALVEARMGSEVVYTRSDDTFIPLETRTEIANERRADLFLSIHANSSPVRIASGVETYYLNFTTSKSDLEVAARENASSQKSVYELKDLLEKIALKDKAEESREFASRIQSSLFTVSTRSNSKSRDRGVKKAPFVVLIGASMPSVLAEIGFVSNPRDEVLLKRADYRQKIAEALYKGLSGYAGTLSHFQVAKN
ncbi:MAG: N-acetylmuramoyl-L-alanine amidase [Bryobacteraceae bacterium]